MLTNISWATYLTGMATLLAVYCAYVLVRYYRTDVLAFLQGRSREPGSRPSGKQDVSEQEGTEEDQYELVEAFAAEIRRHISEAYSSSLENANCLLLLKPTFQRYSNLRFSPFRATLNELIISECAKHGTVMLSEEDLEELWNEVA